MTESAVIDASATLAWLYQEAELGADELALLESGVMFAPPLWRLEVINSILVKERRRLLESDAGDLFLASLADLSIVIADSQLTGNTQTFGSFRL